MAELEKIKLLIDPEVRHILDERRILVEDVREVIDQAGKTGRRLVHRKTGHYLASHKPSTVTFWVEYLPESDRYRVYNAYCHRMTVVAGGSA